MSRLRIARLALALCALLPGAVNAQSIPREAIPLANGTHLFRRVLQDYSVTPLQEKDELAADPQKSILIVLGELGDLDKLPLPLEEFIRRGGAALIATDREARPRALEPFGVSVNGSRVLIPPDSPFAYKEQSDCIFVKPEAGSHLFPEPDPPEGKGVATNRAGYLQQRTNVLQRLARFPEECVLPDGPRLRRRPLLFAAGGQHGEGRILVLSDHSVFINAMLWQNDNSNLDFAYDCVDWLTENGRRTQALFLEEGKTESKFDIPLQNLPPPPLPPLERVVETINRGLQGIEEENRFNTALADVVADLPMPRILRVLVVVLTFGLALYGLSRLSLARYRSEPGVPALPTSPTASGTLLEQRQHALLGGGNLWEAARFVARQGLEALAGAGAVDGGRLPVVRAQGDWRHRWRMRRKVYRLWRLAYDTRPIWITRRRFHRMEHDLEAVHAAAALGMLEIVPARPREDPPPGRLATRSP
jgi:hypothetical protein